MLGKDPKANSKAPTKEKDQGELNPKRFSTVNFKSMTDVFKSYQKCPQMDR